MYNKTEQIQHLLVSSCIRHNPEIRPATTLTSVCNSTIVAIIIPTSAIASVSCRHKFINPISNICWSCLLPISIGQLKVGGGMSPAKRDIRNQASPLCACSKGELVPVPGISLGFWEPARMVDILH